MQFLYMARRIARPTSPPPPVVGSSTPSSVLIASPLDFWRHARWFCWSWASAP